MYYEARITASNGAVALFEFEADNNPEAADHLVHVCGDPCMLQNGVMAWWESRPPRRNADPEGPITKIEYRRHYAYVWHEVEEWQS